MNHQLKIINKTKWIFDIDISSEHKSFDKVVTYVKINSIKKRKRKK